MINQRSDNRRNIDNNFTKQIKPIINVIDKKFKVLEDRIERLEKLEQNNAPQVLKNEFYEEKIENIQNKASSVITKLRKQLVEVKNENKKLERKINELKQELKKERTRK